MGLRVTPKKTQLFKSPLPEVSRKHIYVGGRLWSLKSKEWKQKKDVKMAISKCKTWQESLGVTRLGRLPFYSKWKRTTGQRKLGKKGLLKASHRRESSKVRKVNTNKKCVEICENKVSMLAGDEIRKCDVGDSYSQECELLMGIGTAEQGETSEDRTLDSGFMSEYLDPPANIGECSQQSYSEGNRIVTSTPITSRSGRLDSLIVSVECALESQNITQGDGASLSDVGQLTNSSSNLALLAKYMLVKIGKVFIGLKICIAV